MKGKLVIVDGLDGSGKGVVVDSFREYFESKGKKVFDLRECWKEGKDTPEFDEIKDYDVIVSCEPTYTGVGKVLRDEIVKKNARKYSGLSTAHAFALDRAILYKKLFIPALAAGKMIFQERGVVTSLVYQPVQLERISLRDIIMIPGNNLAVKYAPDLLVITKVDPKVVMKRLENREKKDHAIFEEIFFQRKVADRFESEWLKQLFEKRGSKVVYLDTNPPKTVDDTKRDAVEIVEDLINEAPLI